MMAHLQLLARHGFLNRRGCPVGETSMSRAQLKVAGGGWVDDTTLQLAQRQAERR
jgi:hypothetical protein